MEADEGPVWPEAVTPLLNHHLDGLLKKDGFKVSAMDPCLYWRGDVYLLLYVDDILLFSSNEEEIAKVKALLMSKVSIRDMGKAERFLNINVKKEGQVYTIDQADYIQKLAQRFNLEECRRASKPLPSGIGELEKTKADLKCTRPIRSLIGGLLYLANVSRPDIMASVSLLSRFMSKPSELLWSSACQVLRYLVATKDRKLKLGKLDEKQLEVYADSDFASDVQSRKSQSGFLVKLYGSTVCWYSKKQSTVSTSSGEAELVALASGVSETIGVKQLLEELGIVVATPIPIKEDNKTCIIMVKDGTRVKHIDVKYHFVQDHIKKGTFKVEYISTSDQAADVLTKANPSVPFDRICVEQLGLT